MIILSVLFFYTGRRVGNEEGNTQGYDSGYELGHTFGFLEGLENAECDYRGGFWDFTIQSCMMPKYNILWEHKPCLTDDSYLGLNELQLKSQACHNKIINSSGCFLSYGCDDFKDNITISGVALEELP